MAIPALNEAHTIRQVVEDVSEAVPEAAILVVDDHSRDNSGQLARDAGAAVVTMPFTVGVGGAMRTAYLYARDNGFDTVVQVDGDGQHDPASVPLLIEGLDSASVVVGSRFLTPGGYRVSGPRRWAMRALALALTRACRTPLTDVTSGFRAYDRRAVALFADHYPAEYLGDTVEALVIASRAGLVVREIPAPMRARQGGRPSQGPVASALYLARAMLALVVAVGRRPSEAAP